MTAEHRQRIYDLFTAALPCDPSGREALLQGECAGEPGLRVEVERLLSQDAQANRDRFLTPPTPTGQGGGVQRLLRLWQEGRRPDLRHFLADAGSLSPEQLAAVARADRRGRWQRGDRVETGWYLREFPILASDIEIAVELIYGEFLLREELGESPSLGEYQRAYPQYAERLRLRAELHREPEERTITAQDRARASGGGTPSPSWPSPPGYEVLRTLGQGQMGVVYLARQQRLNRLVALKLIRAGDLATPEERRRFTAEAEAVAQVPHPHIVQVFDVGEHDGLLFMAMEYVEGGSLAARLDGRPMAARPAAMLIQAVARGVHAAHRRGIIHRDLKPANILLAEDGLPKVADFGLAKRLEGPTGSTTLGVVVGTPAYMAPEQAAGDSRAIGPAADLHALGATLYELLTGRPPFRADTVLELLEHVRSSEPVPPSRLQPDVPRDLEIICLKCLNKDPRRRHGDAESLAEDLRRFLEPQPVQGRVGGPVERLWGWCRRRAVAVLALTSFIAVIIVGVIWIRPRPELPRPAAAGSTTLANHGSSDHPSAEDFPEDTGGNDERKVPTQVGAGEGTRGEGAAGVPPGVGAMLRALTDEDAEVRRSTAESLGRHKYAAVVEALAGALGDEDGAVRRAAANSLATQGDPAAVPALMRHVADEAWDAGPEGPLVFVGPFRPAYDDRGWGSKDAALQALAKLAPEKLTEAAMAALKAKNPRVRSWAAQRLADPRGH